MASLLSSMLLFMVCLSCMVTAQTPMPECSSCWCHNAGDCPDPKDSCPAVRNCRTAVVKDKCGCCDVCLKSIGETCRREPLEREDEKCDKGLTCVPGNDAWYCDSMKPENVKVRRCEKGEWNFIAYLQHQALLLKISCRYFNFLYVCSCKRNSYICEKVWHSAAWCKHLAV